ncbi:LAFE_0G03180g1_1 [Lachancea fermentati]|uniref:LAFE_0G03180g1_1 n=1 Tax=Lachancea fermentati TaxID=4955 RepID=A0A1G4MGU5_LACFM|nr:LAFE_0G03180g1_1 [Lachancea fermentati]
MAFEDKQKKPLRSCVRCRKNKTKCDSICMRPGPCTPCSRKGVECVLDYVAPPQRSKELRVLCDSVDYVRESLDMLCQSYDKLLKEVGELPSPVKNVKCSSTKVLKIAENSFVVISLDDYGLKVNDFKIGKESVESAFRDFRRVLSNVLVLYGRWESGVEKGFVEGVHDEFLAQYRFDSLFRSNQLLVLLCILNFYFDVPGLDYLLLFDNVVDDYCTLAVDDYGSGRSFTRKSLAKVVVGTVPTSLSTEFHSELFVKRFTLYLFFHVVFYGPAHFLDSFLYKYIKTLENLRKKINFDRNWEVRWVNFYIRLFDLVEHGGGSVESWDKSNVFVSMVKSDEEVLGGGDLGKEFCNVVESVYSDLIEFYDVDEWRLAFVNLFFTQVVVLNLILCVNRCGGLRDLLESFSFNGFNFDVYEALTDELHDGEAQEYYLLQGKLRYVNKYVVLKVIGCSVGEHKATVSESDVYYMIGRDARENTQRRNIYKSSCKLIWNLYQLVVYEDMLSKVCSVIPVEWDPQSSLEACGLVAKFNDVRSKELPSILQDVDWVKESADDVLRKIHGVI